MNAISKTAENLAIGDRVLVSDAHGSDNARAIVRLERKAGYIFATIEGLDGGRLKWLASDIVQTVSD